MIPFVSIYYYVCVRAYVCVHRKKKSRKILMKMFIVVISKK